jgi:hypothetical protein
MVNGYRWEGHHGRLISCAECLGALIIPLCFVIFLKMTCCLLSHNRVKNITNVQMNVAARFLSF